MMKSHRGDAYAGGRNTNRLRDGFSCEHWDAHVRSQGAGGCELREGNVKKVGDHDALQAAWRS